MGCTFKLKKDTDKFGLDRWRTERSLFIPVLEHNNNNVVSNMAFSLNLAREREMNTIRKHHLVTVFYCNGSATIKHLAFRLRPPPVPRTTNTLTHANQKNDSRIYRPHPQFCVFKTTRFRCHPKRIDRFQSTLKRSKTIDIARCDVS